MRNEHNSSNGGSGHVGGTEVSDTLLSDSGETLFRGHGDSSTAFKLSEGAWFFHSYGVTQ